MITIKIKKIIGAIVLGCSLAPFAFPDAYMGFSFSTQITNWTNYTLSYQNYIFPASSGTYTSTASSSQTLESNASSSFTNSSDDSCSNPTTSCGPHFSGSALLVLNTENTNSIFSFTMVAMTIANYDHPSKDPIFESGMNDDMYYFNYGDGGNGSFAEDGPSSDGLPLPYSLDSIAGRQAGTSPYTCTTTGCLGDFVALFESSGVATVTGTSVALNGAIPTIPLPGSSLSSWSIPPNAFLMRYPPVTNLNPLAEFLDHYYVVQLYDAGVTGQGNDAYTDTPPSASVSYAVICENMSGYNNNCPWLGEAQPTPVLPS